MTYIAKKFKSLAELQENFVPRKQRWPAPPGSELADLRMQVHRVYDTLWEFDTMNRKTMYARLAQALRIPIEECHIGMFDEDLCRRALAARGRAIFIGKDVAG